MERLPDEIAELEPRLLLYAAGELPTEEASALEGELKADASLRDALDEMRGLLVGTQASVSAIQSAEAVPQRSVRRARDRAVRAVFAWAQGEKEARVLRASRHHPLAEGMVWRYARWPLAAAAVLVVGLMIWTFTSEPPANRGVATTADSGAGAQTPLGEQPLDGGAASQPSSGFGLDQVAALFDNPERNDADLFAAEFAGGLSEELVALRLLEEPDYE